MKPGYKTTEFWMCLLVLVGGIILLAVGKDEAGWTLIGLATASYAGSRGIAKIGGGKNFLLLGLVIPGLTTGLSGCHAGPSLEWVAAKHNAEVAHTALIFPEYQAYVEADTSLIQVQKDDRINLMKDTEIRLQKDQEVLNKLAESR